MQWSIYTEIRNPSIIFIQESYTYQNVGCEALSGMEFPYMKQLMYDLKSTHKHFVFIFPTSYHKIRPTQHIHLLTVQVW